MELARVLAEIQTDYFFLHILLQSQKQATPTTRDTRKSVVTQQVSNTCQKCEDSEYFRRTLIGFSENEHQDYTRGYKMNSKTHYN